MKEVVSIIVPVYNNESYLNRCIDSILKQNYTSYEVILIDDGSTDASSKMCDTYKENDVRIRVFHQENAGASASRNFGIKKARGKYITFVDSDDWIEPNTLELLVEKIEKEKVDCVRTSYFIDTHETQTEWSLNVRPGMYCAESLSSLAASFMSGKEQCYTWLLMVKRESLLKTHLFNESLYILEDKSFHLNLFNNIDSIYVLDTPTYHYYLNPQSVTKAPDNNIRNIAGIINAHKDMVTIAAPSTLESEKLVSLFSLSNANLITDRLYQIYKHTADKNHSVLYATLSRLRKDDDYRKLINEVKFKSSMALVGSDKVKGLVKIVFAHATTLKNPLLINALFGVRSRSEIIKKALLSLKHS